MGVLEAVADEEGVPEAVAVEEGVPVVVDEGVLDGVEKAVPDCVALCVEEAVTLLVGVISMMHHDAAVSASEELAPEMPRTPMVKVCTPEFPRTYEMFVQLSCPNTFTLDCASMNTSTYTPELRVSRM